MSWSLNVMPLHLLGGSGGWDEFPRPGLSYGMPDEPPPARPLPTVLQVLETMRRLGLHGSADLRVAGAADPEPLPTCPDPWACYASAGPDLGEVAVFTRPKTPDGAPPAPDAAVDFIACRKPVSPAVLAMARELSADFGPILVFDDHCDHVVVGPDDDAALRAVWPWGW